jgi:hypothetical protein
MNGAAQRAGDAGSQGCSSGQPALGGRIAIVADRGGPPWIESDARGWTRMDNEREQGQSKGQQAGQRPDQGGTGSRDRQSAMTDVSDATVTARRALP